jgi:NDP-hexose 4-ketoreductase
MALEVIGRGLLARAFTSVAEEGFSAIICASGVSDSSCPDEDAFWRERALLKDVAARARASDAVLVYFSAAPVYGRASGLRSELDIVTPLTPYGRHKLECERLLAADRARFLILRLPNVVGPGGNPQQLIPSLVAQALRGSVITKIGATRDLLDVDDLVRIVTALLRKGIHNEVLNVASGISTPVPRLVACIVDVLGASPSISEIDGGDAQEFSTNKVRGLLKNYPYFMEAYPFQVLRRRVPAIVEALQVKGRLE